MAISEEYIKDHNIKSVSLISEDTMAPRLLIKVDEEVLSIDVTEASTSNISDIDKLIEDKVYEYEWNKKIKERKLKLDKLIKK